MNRTARTILIALALTLAFAGPAAAAVQPLAWKSVDVTTHNEQSGTIMLIAGKLPDGTKLPAEMELWAPAGAKLSWVGEILGGDVSADPAVQYKLTTKGGVDTYRFTLTQARIAQLEVLTPGTMNSTDGTNYTVAKEWTPGSAVAEVNMSVRIPVNAQIVQPIPGAEKQPGPTGYSYYSRTVKNAKAGKPIAMAFSYSAPPAPAVAASANASGSGSLIPVILLVVAVGGFAYLLMNVNRKMEGRQVSEEAYDEDEDEEDDEGEEYEDEDDEADEVEDEYEDDEDEDEEDDEVEELDAFEEEPVEQRPAAKSTKVAQSAKSTKSTTVAQSTKSTRSTKSKKAAEAAKAAQAAAAAQSPRDGGAKKKLAIVVGVAVIGVLLFATLARTSGNNSELASGTFTVDFGNPSACTNVSIAVSPAPGVDLKAKAKAVVESLRPIEGMGKVTLDLNAGRLNAGFCASSTSESELRSTLAATGLVVVGGPSSQPSAQ